MSNETEIEQWKKRMVVVGQAQARYLWVLLLIGLFYWALFSGIRNKEPIATIKAPIFGVNLSSDVLFASAPFVIFLILIIIHGTFRAFGTAERKVNTNNGNTEPYDLAPNAIDFAAYNPQKNQDMPQALLLLAYPLYLSIFWFEGILIWISLVNSELEILGWWFFVVFGALLGITASILMLIFWKTRLQKIWNILTKPKSSA